MQRIEVNGQKYAIPFVDLLPRHTPEQLNGLREAIQATGRIVDPITVGVTSHGRTIIDGATRATIAAELGMSVPTDDQGDLTDDEAQQMAEDLNAHRRHLTPDQYAAVLSRQLAKKRSQGKSVRVIADEMGMPRSTAHRMIAAQYTRGEQLSHSGTVDDDDDEEDELPPLPSRITSRNGKSYPARRAEPTDDELLSDVTRPTPSKRIDTAETGELDKLARGLEMCREAVAALAELDGPRFKRLAKLAKRYKIPIREGKSKPVEALIGIVKSVATVKV